jgi:hypothetical protein
MKIKDILESITDFDTLETEEGVNLLQLRIKTKWYTLSIRDYVEINPDTGRRWKRKHVLVDSGRKTPAKKINRKPKTSDPDSYNKTGHYFVGPSMHRAGLAEQEAN